MIQVKEEELRNIEGGGINWGILAGVGAAVSFFIGFFDGWTNPKRCN